jgi:acetolactate synthase-1/2/3 large subunit
LKNFIQETFKEKGAVIAEVFVNMAQNFEPKSATKRLEDGTLVSAPLEDLAPFLPREELLKNMLIPMYTPPPPVG